MTSNSMAKGYLARALARANALAVFFDAGSWPDVVRESQEAVELFLKAALRFAGIEPVRAHDVSEPLRANAARFPEFFAEKIPDLAYISSVLAGDRGPAFYGDERRSVPPDEEALGGRTRWNWFSVAGILEDTGARAGGSRSAVAFST